MLDNQTLRITKNNGETVEYNGVIYSSKKEAAAVLHPDYWDEIPVGKMRVFNSRDAKLIRINENTMLIRVNGSRHFVQVGS
jgi:hypothetical protein